MVIITAGSIAWAIAAYAVLRLTGSTLPRQVLRRKAA